MKHIHALLINPFIYDFAAYNFWSKPLGLLYVGSILRKNGFEVSLIDCMQTDEKRKREDGRGHYIKERVEKPEALKAVDKPFRRYGMSPETLKKKLQETRRPDMVLLTSLMTYWYLGTFQVARIVREVFPDSKIVVGGIYPTLCEEHAKEIMDVADLIVKNQELDRFYSYIEETFSVTLTFKPRATDLIVQLSPAFDLYAEVDFIPLLTSVGCVFKCTYCATNYLYPELKKRDPKSVIEEVSYWRSCGVKRFVLYDDCFLHDKRNHAIPILKGLKSLSGAVEIFNPNALNATFIDSYVAELLLEAGFKEVRIGLETTNPETQRTTGGKVNTEIFKRAISALKSAGFNEKNIHVYLLAGLPFQRWEDVKEGIDYVLEVGCKPYIAEYAPCPHTSMFEKYKRFARFPIDEEPLFHNNSLFPFAWSGFNEENLQFLKSYLRTRTQ